MGPPKSDVGPKAQGSPLIPLSPTRDTVSTRWVTGTPQLLASPPT